LIHDREICEILLRGQNTVTHVPSTRWSEGLTSSNISNSASNYGAFCRRVMSFDLAAFGVSPAESHSMNPIMALGLEAGNVVIQNINEL